MANDRPRLELKDIFMIEISICVLIAALVLSGTFAHFKNWIIKAQLIGYAAGADGETVPAIEHFDLTGSFSSDTPAESDADALIKNGADSPDELAQSAYRQRHYSVRNDGFSTMAGTTWLDRPLTMNFLAHPSDARGYTVMLTCQSSNVPLALVRMEQLEEGQDAIGACREAVP